MIIDDGTRTPSVHAPARTVTPEGDHTDKTITEPQKAAQRPRRTRASAKAAGTRSLADRLWSRVDRTGDGCWEWQGYRMPKCHGQIGRGRRVDRLALTHRVAWELTNGPIPDGQVVRHRCDNPPCCRPDHLELGTTQDNTRDAVERGLIARGARLPQVRLTDHQVDEIRAAYRRFTVPGLRGYRSNRDELAAKYGVSGKYIVAIAGGRERVS